MNRAQLRSRPPKVEGTFISASTHPDVFAANPGLRALAARRGGKVLMDDETLSAFAPSTAAQASAALVHSPAMRSQSVTEANAGSGDPDAFMDSYFASKRDAAERMAAARARPRR